MCQQRSMLWQVIVSGVLAVGARAYAPILWTGLPDHEFVLAPMALQSRALLPPQKLVIRGAFGGMSADEIPKFTMQRDTTITWDAMGWCIEATGDRLGDAVRLNLCTGGPAQKWKWVPSVHGGMFQLRETNKCLDIIEAEGDWNRVPIALKDCDGTLAKSWSFGEVMPLLKHGASNRSARSYSITRIMASFFVMVMIGMVSLSAFVWRVKRCPPALTLAPAAMPCCGNEGGVTLTETSTLHQEGLSFKLFARKHLPAVMTLGPAPLKEHASESAIAIDTSVATAAVLFVVPGSSPSSFGATSPEPSPQWLKVAEHLSSRLPGFDDRIASSVITEEEIEEDLCAERLSKWARKIDVIVALGVQNNAAPSLSQLANKEGTSALLCYGCASEITTLQRVGAYRRGAGGFSNALQGFQANLAPWAAVAQGQRLSEQADLLLSRNSSEDLLYAIFFVLHAFVLDISLVRHTVNPTWEKGPLRNAKEFASMVSCCSKEITAAISDPETKETIDLLNACDMRDQVGSYRVIVSRETPQLEDFSLCILQQNNVFGCDAQILENPRVPVIQSWRGSAPDSTAARQIFIGHFDCDESHPEASARLPWSWKIVTGANPAYDAFPAQHQIFYPSKKSASALWYDPVFKVETLDGRQIWTKRHYRVTPREVKEDLRGPGGTSAGAWTLTTLDNGVISREHWTIVDAADDLSWAIFHYSGAAAAVGQSYLGALLCSVDGQWPADAQRGEELERIRAAFCKCGIEFWELYGHGPPDSGKSFMWTHEHMEWEKTNPPPLEPIGDQTVQAWRASAKKVRPVVSA